MKKKVIVFIDCFNLHHAINAYPKYHKYKWLDLSKLANLYITKNESIVDILYFTALATWNQNKVKKHKLFIKANELNGVHVIFGEFKKRDKFCNLRKRKYQTFEDKQTDVNIVIQLFKLSIEKKYDKAIIISGDSDLIPSINAVRKTFPNKQIGVVIPIARRAEELKHTCDFYMKMKEKQLASAIFQQKIKINDNEFLVCPPEWS
jgi:uncharacterized LabA/DUF88 family protein